MTAYYVDSVGGSDSNSGTSAGSALKSLAAVASLKLKPGDTVLLARGSSFTDTLTLTKSGTADNPITITAYGTGADPKLVGAQGIIGTKTANIVVSHLDFQTSGGAIYAAAASNWLIDQVSLTNAGQATGTGSISMRDGTNVTISNSQFDHVANDGIYVVGMTNLAIVNNSFRNLSGETADAIQVTGSTNVVASGNVIDQTGSNTTKGGVIMEDVTHVEARGNTVTGGSFGIAVNGWDVVIADNTIIGQTMYNWSAAILISEGKNLADYVITGNTIANANFGVALTGLTSAGAVTRDNIQVSGNSFTGMASAALKVDKASTGSFHDNLVVDSRLTWITGDGTVSALATSGNTVVAALDGTTSALSQLIAQGTKNAAAAAAPLQFGINPDKFAIDSQGHAVTGNILANDVDAAGKTLTLAAVGGVAVSAKALNGAASVAIAGTYGTLQIAADGSFTYTLAPDAAGKLKIAGAATDVFTYKATDGGKVVSSTIDIDLTSYLKALDAIGTSPQGAGKSALSDAATPAGATSQASISTANDSLAGRILGTSASDTLRAAGGSHLLYGQGGNDDYVVTSGEQAIEFAGQGYDTVYAIGSYTLAAGSEIETLVAYDQAGTEAFDFVGNALDNRIIGNAGDNTLRSGGGADILYGQGGNDNYVVSGAEQVIEMAGEGYDTVYTTGSFALSAGSSIETLVAYDQAGTAELDLSGNALAQRIIGNAGNNTLRSGGGADILYGQGGNDSYVVRGGEQVIEVAGEGYDTVYAYGDFALGAGSSIETLVAYEQADTRAIALRGNELSNRVIGNAGANMINGGGGNDELWGQGGADSFVFDTPLSAGGNVDRIGDFEHGIDHIVLDRHIFTALAAGSIDAGTFAIGTQAHDAGVHLLFDPASGALYYDADGAGGVEAVQFAILAPGTALSAGDFIVT